MPDPNLNPDSDPYWPSGGIERPPVCRALLCAVLQALDQLGLDPCVEYLATELHSLSLPVSQLLAVGSVLDSDDSGSDWVSLGQRFCHCIRLGLVCQ
jgi:hypothetical protein